MLIVLRRSHPLLYSVQFTWFSYCRLAMRVCDTCKHTHAQKLHTCAFLKKKNSILIQSYLVLSLDRIYIYAFVCTFCTFYAFAFLCRTRICHLRLRLWHLSLEQLYSCQSGYQTLSLIFLYPILLIDLCLSV